MILFSYLNPFQKVLGKYRLTLQTVTHTRRYKARSLTIKLIFFGTKTKIFIGFTQHLNTYHVAMKRDF